jgi:hypothetical protein
LIAGLAAFGLGEATYKIIPPKKVMLNTMGTIAPAVTGEGLHVANTRNAALAIGILGACLGCGLGIAGGLARGAASGTVAAGLLGAILGAALPSVVTLASLKSFGDTQFYYSDYDLFISMGMHGLLWGLAGAVAGLAFAVGLGRPRLIARATVAGVLGAVIGAVAFDLIGAALFSLADTGEAISTTWTSRFAARMLVALATAVLVVFSLPAPSPSNAEGPPPPTVVGESEPARP